MRIAICDDEKIFRAELQQQLETHYCSLDVLITTYASGEALVHAMEKTIWDLVFLDIEMPGMDGLKAAKRIHEAMPGLPVIFLTSHTELAMAGYEVQAFRFLAKPIEQKKLAEALQAFEKTILADSRIAIMEEGVRHYLSCKNICYIKSENVYLKIVTEQNSYLIRKKQKELLEELPQNLFLAVHRSYIVNLGCVTAFDGTKVSLKDGSSIPVSKSRCNDLKQQMLRYMKENY